jgi:UDP:flavonoid glycosyltransferase YjiC (YdhE family)
MRVLFSSTWGFGHTFPMVPLARAFVAAGHQVRWAANQPACGAVAAAGLEVVQAGLDTAGVAAVESRLGVEAGALLPQDRAAFAFPTMFGAWVAPIMLPDLLDVAKRWNPDLLIHEQGELATPLVGALLGIPVVTHSFGGAVPLDLVTAAGVQLTELWGDHGLAVPMYAGCFADGYLDICPSSVQSVSLAHVRARQPLRPECYAGEAGGPLPSMVTIDDPRPLVYLTLGTVRAAAPVLIAAIQGLAALPVRVLVAVGPSGDPDALGAVPGNVEVARWVQQSEVLKHASLVVSHAGSGTFLGCLERGLPQLCLPQAADQFRNATGAISSGVGLVLVPTDASAEAIQQAASALLGQGSFSSAAAGVAAEIAAMPSPAKVVGVLAALA